MIPVFEPEIGEEEITAVTAALRKGEISGTFGHDLSEFEKQFASYCGSNYGIAVSSGTTALHLAVAALELNQGDEVLVSASTNIATALAAYHNRLIPVAVDSETTTWNLDPDKIEKLITPRTKAIIPVHLFGHPANMLEINRIANKYDLSVIEDCAEAHGATIKGQKVGSFGKMGCFSFYANKVITTGEGGMIVTNDKNLADKLKLLRNLGFGTPRFYHEVAGYNFRMTNFQAAMGLVQLNKIENIISKKRQIAQQYSERLSQVSALQLPIEEPGVRNVYWMYGILLNTQSTISRDKLSEKLEKDGIQTRTFFCPMNQQPFLSNLPGYKQIDCPVADNLWKNGLYLPSSINLSEEQIDFITDCVKAHLTV